VAVDRAPAESGAEPPRNAGLRVGGFVPFSGNDFPGKLAAVVFCQGCPWRCGYCQNPHLIPAQGTAEQAWQHILDWLDTRCGLLDAVIFSGGEPTAQIELHAAMRAVRARGFAVGLHTSGIYPRRLAELAQQLDWVGLDIKAPVGTYGKVTGIASSGAAAFASLDLLQRSGVALEVRTTIHLDLTPRGDLLELARQLGERGVRSWVLQMFRPTGCASQSLVAAAQFGTRLPPGLLPELAAYVPEISVR
jgi:pyruvate formate lyase activating enzyme